VQLQHGGASGGPGVTVGDARCHSLLQGQDVMELRKLLQGIEKSLFDRSRITEHMRYSVGEELFDDRSLTGPGHETSFLHQP
jgi:hypothetical protein